jgi:hypothetical protein
MNRHRFRFLNRHRFRFDLAIGDSGSQACTFVELEDSGWEWDGSAIIMVLRRPSSCRYAITSAPRSPIVGRGMVSTVVGP